MSTGPILNYPKGVGNLQQSRRARKVLIKDEVEWDQWVPMLAHNSAQAKVVVLEKVAVIARREEWVAVEMVVLISHAEVLEVPQVHLNTTSLRLVHADGHPIGAVYKNALDVFDNGFLLRTNLRAIQVPKLSHLPLRFLRLVVILSAVLVSGLDVKILCILLLFLFESRDRFVRTGRS
jgi:hypothetical protein